MPPTLKRVRGEHFGLLHSIIGAKQNLISFANVVVSSCAIEGVTIVTFFMELDCIISIFSKEKFWYLE